MVLMNDQCSEVFAENDVLQKATAFFLHEWIRTA